MVVDGHAGTDGLGYAGRNLRYEIEKKKQNTFSKLIGSVELK